MVFTRKGVAILVDDEDYPVVSKYNWWITNHGYARSSVWCPRQKKVIGIGMSRLLINAPAHLSVDHINHDKLDNRRCNLRLCTHSQNMANTPRRTWKRSSRFKGVYWLKCDKTWIVKIYHRRQELYIGRFRREEDAAEAYNKAAKAIYGEFAFINPKQ